jgi:ribosomal protein L10
MDREQKAAAIAEVATEIQESEAIIAVDYRGISVPQAAALRARLRENDATFRIVKNTLTERAADEVGAEGLKPYLQGPTAMTFVKGDVAAAAKALTDFRRTEGLLEFKGGWMNGAPWTRRRSRRSPSCRRATSCTDGSSAWWPPPSPASRRRWVASSAAWRVSSSRSPTRAWSPARRLPPPRRGGRARACRGGSGHHRGHPGPRRSGPARPGRRGAQVGRGTRSRSRPDT